MKMARQRWQEMLLILGRSGTQYVAMVTKLLSSAHVLKSHRKESNISDTNWLRFNKLTSVFYASVLLLIMNFVITLVVKVAVDPRGDSRVDPQTTLTRL